MIEKGKKHTRKKTAPGAAAAPAARPASQVAGPAPERGQPRPGPISADERRRMVAEAAYYRAERRGFKGGNPDRDWLEAESEIDAWLLRRP